MKNFVFQGDSITDMGRNRDNDDYMGCGYPTLVSGKLGAKYPGEFKFFNKGISGNRIVDIDARIKCDIINLAPDILTILIGINDVWHELNLRKNGVANDKYYRVYCDMIEEIKARCPGVKIYILEPFVLKASATENNWGIFRSETELRAQSAKKVAEKYELTFIPLQEKFDRLCEKADASYWLLDGVHPSAMGHQVISDAVCEAIEKDM